MVASKGRRSEERREKIKDKKKTKKDKKKRRRAVPLHRRDGALAVLPPRALPHRACALVTREDECPVPEEARKLVVRGGQERVSQPETGLLAGRRSPVSWPRPASRSHAPGEEGLASLVHRAQADAALPAGRAVPVADSPWRSVSARLVDAARVPR